MARDLGVLAAGGLLVLQEEAVGGGDDAQDLGRDLAALVELAQLLLDRVAGFPPSGTYADLDF